MYRNSAQHHPLPDDFPQSLCEVDDRLARSAHRSTAPSGLAERVFAASSVHLRQATLVEAGPALRFVPAPVPLHQTRWARMAMAACFALACVAAIWLLQAPSLARTNEFHSLEMVHASTSAHYEANIGYLFHTLDLTSEDVQYDLTTLASMF